MCVGLESCLAQFDETYSFYFRSNGSLKLWIDDKPVSVDQPIELRARQLYDIKVEYIREDPNVEAIVELQWSGSNGSPTTPKAVISQTQLYSNSGTSVSSFGLPLKSYHLLHKVALLLNTLNISAKELAYLSLHPKDFADFDLNTLLPRDKSEIKPPAALFDQWRRLAKLFALKKSLPRSEIGLIDIFEFAATNGDKTILSRETIKQLATAASQSSDSINLLSDWVGGSDKAALKEVLQNEDWTGLSDTAIKKLITDQGQPLTHFVNLLARLTDLEVLVLMLATATGWDIKDLNTLIVVTPPPPALNLTLASFKDERSLFNVQACIRLIRRLGISAENMLNWATQSPDSSQAQDIKNTVKAKYDEQTWLTVAKPLNDKLRESQKTALIAYVLTMPEIRKANVTHSNRLFDYFLIDVEMGACMATSRIKQALSSIQLFVQRSLLNLEPGVQPNAIKAEQWQWMKNYRVWEANRKVFLYPENWIEPELRDDKSPFFKELESELLQNDLTNEVAEKTLSNYLYKLDQVARLEICGMYLQEDFGQEEDYPTILHVFGRTMGGATRSYYYRRLIDSRMWTPWEKVELDIQGLQGDDEDYSLFHIPQNGIDLLPVIWNRRLYLFWLILTKKTKKADPPEPITPTSNKPIAIKEPQPYWEIKLAWSKYDQGKWKPKQVSEGTLESNSSYPNMFRLRTSIGEDNDLELHVFENGGRFGKYHFENYNDDIRVTWFTTADRVFVVDGVQPYIGSIAGSSIAPYFMGYIGNNGLNLKIQQRDEIRSQLEAQPRDDIVTLPILDNTPIYTFLSLNQYYPRPLSSPYFYQDKDSVYFVRSREDYEMIVEQVKDPANVFPPIYEKPIYNEPVYSVANIHDQLHPPSPDPVMNKAVVNPWISAEQQLTPRKLKAFSDQLGVVL